MDPACPTAMSAIPSPLKSPATMDWGLDPVVGLWVEVVHVTPGNVCARAGDPAIPPTTKMTAARNEKLRSRTPRKAARKRYMGCDPCQMSAIIGRIIRGSVEVESTGKPYRHAQQRQLRPMLPAFPGMTHRKFSFSFPHYEAVRRSAITVEE
jgi:hypothetical protein